MNSLKHQIYVIFYVFTICQRIICCKDEPVTDDAAGSTVRIEVLPESINELITDEINITCMPQDLPQGTKDILFIELGKEGEHPIAALKGPKLELGAGMKNNIQAKGHITKNVSQSFLQLTIKRPFVDDVNVYCCRMFYQNEFGELKMGHVYADVSIENNDKAVFVHLLNKVSDLESYTIDLENNVSEQNRYTKYLENTIKEQGKQLTEQNTTASSRIKELENSGANRGRMIQEIVDRDNFTTAFSVYGTKVPFSPGETLVFNHFILSIGNHYDITTGVFTTPRTGLYVFHVSMIADTQYSLNVHLKKNDVIVASMYAYYIKWASHSSESTVISLKTGDKVWPEIGNNGGKVAFVNDKYTIFNGYLLQLL